MPPRAAYNEQVAAMVRRELGKDPSVGNDTLREKALDIDRGLRRLSPRQFHATYRLPALRSVGAVGGRGGAAVSTPAAVKKTERASAPASVGVTARRAKRAEPTPGGAPPDVAPQTGAGATGTGASDAASLVTTSSNGDGAARGASRSMPEASVPETAATAGIGGSPEAARASTSKALARPHAAEREAVRAMLQTVAREALSTEDRAGFVRLLDSLDQRATVILGLFGRT